MLQQPNGKARETPENPCYSMLCFTFSHIKNYISLDIFSDFLYQRSNVQDSYLCEKEQGLSIKQRKRKFWTRDAYYQLMANNFKRILSSDLPQFCLSILTVGVGASAVELVHLFSHDFPVKWTSMLESIIYPLPLQSYPVSAVKKICKYSLILQVHD